MAFNGPTFSLFTCPECGKRRMQRPADHEVIREKRAVKVPDGRTVEHHIDVCHPCVLKLQKKYYQPGKTELQKVLKALHNPDVQLGDKSLEDLL